MSTQDPFSQVDDTNTGATSGASGGYGSSASGSADWTEPLSTTSGAGDV